MGGLVANWALPLAGAAQGLSANRRPQQPSSKSTGRPLSSSHTPPPAYPSARARDSPACLRAGPAQLCKAAGAHSLRARLRVLMGRSPCYTYAGLRTPQAQQPTDLKRSAKQNWLYSGPGLDYIENSIGTGPPLSTRLVRESPTEATYG
ncbi:hypothetical protein P3342_011250 [Pyrenophora teres f. teres]|nr:hypothetical protein P3342_011250 [Pyrenophora teres f. teres]